MKFVLNAKSTISNTLFFLIKLLLTKKFELILQNKFRYSIALCWKQIAFMRELIKSRSYLEIKLFRMSWIYWTDTRD